MPFEKTAVIAYRVADTVEIVNVFYGGGTMRPCIVDTSHGNQRTQASKQL